MSNPSQSVFGSAAALTDPFEFMQKMWQGASLPGIAMPSLSVEEINKKITDLKAVESWLTLNMNLLRGTIQTLEVQSGTLAALQSMSAALGAGSVSAAPSNQPANTPADTKFESPVFSTGPSGTTGASGAANASAPAPATAAVPPPAGFSFPRWDAPADASASDQTATPVASANPGVWWNLLQQQFAQAVGRAVNETTAATPAPAEPKAGTAAQAARSTKATKLPKSTRATKSTRAAPASGKSATRQAPRKR